MAVSDIRKFLLIKWQRKKLQYLERKIVKIRIICLLSRDCNIVSAGE